MVSRIFTYGGRVILLNISMKISLGLEFVCYREIFPKGFFFQENPSDDSIDSKARKMELLFYLW